VINAEYEFTNLAKALGPEQPVYAFRSLYFLGDSKEDVIQALALGYVKDIEQVHPDGPLFLLGHCDGCKIAMPMAQHLLRRGRHLPLLILLEWMIEPASFPGEVLLLYARDSEYNPKFAAINLEPAWRRMYGEFSHAEIDGEHDVFLDNTASLADELARRCAQAFDRSRPFSPLKDCAFEFAVAKAPGRARPGARLRFEASVKNVGKAPIGGEHTNSASAVSGPATARFTGPVSSRPRACRRWRQETSRSQEPVFMHRRMRGISNSRSISSRSGDTR
jgi:hypothetical protein